jgi:hypothetical protein
MLEILLNLTYYVVLQHEHVQIYDEVLQVIMDMHILYI